jgi:hypothetical protein
MQRRTGELRSQQASGLAVAVAVVMATVTGCITPQKRDVEKAQEALAACEAEHGIDHPECEELRLRKKDAQARYEKKAREAWACDPTQDQCPTPR